MKVDILGFLRSLSFGGLLGGGVAYLICLKYPQLLVEKTTPEMAVIFGSLLGASLHRAIDALIVQGLLPPFGRTVHYYTKLAEARFLKRNGIITERECNQIEKGLLRKYFDMSSDGHGKRKEIGTTKGPVKESAEESVEKPTKESVKD
jgi:hypothetical protein